MKDAYQQIIDTLSKCKRVLVTTHVRPDGDALGTSAAMVLGLRKAGIEAEVLLLSHLPRKYAFVFRENNVVHHDVEKGWPEKFPFDRFDALLVVDTGTWSQLPGLRERIANWNVPKLVVDHHLTQEDWATAKLVVTQAAAAAEVAAELLEYWDIPFDPAIAGALFLGIASDTGWFQFSNTRPYTLRLAAMLMEYGVNTDIMYQHLYQDERAERYFLHARGMQSLELLVDGRLAVIGITKEDFAATGSNVGDTENLINAPLQIRTVEACILIVEPPEGGPIRVSFRSKGQVDVARFAEQFGGGGHARASGAKLDGDYAAARQRVIAAMQQKLQK